MTPLPSRKVPSDELNYTSPPSFEALRFISIERVLQGKDSLEKFIEVVLLGQFELAGYYNRVSAKLRFFSALIQTIWATFFLVMLVKAVRQIGYTNLDDPLLNSVALCALISAIFGATYLREMKDIHNKWDYLARTFNDVIKLDTPTNTATTYSRREHLAASLAHDILVMNMWAHRSYRSFFKEILEKSVIYQCRGDHAKIHSRLTVIAAGKIDYVETQVLISDYLESLRPAADKPNIVSRQFVAPNSSRTSNGRKKTKRPGKVLKIAKS